MAPSYQFLEDAAEPKVDIGITINPAATGSLSIGFDWRDAGNYYSLDLAPGTATLRSVIAGVPHRLATTALKWGASHRITLKRRLWMMQLIVDKSVQLTAYDATFDGGKIGLAAGGGWTWHDERVQPIEEIYFTDDFTRAPGETSEWKPATGKWELTSSSDAINDRNVEMSANPFGYQVATPDGDAFVQSGRWFWDNYDAQVSVKPAGPGVIGLAVDVQDAKNFIAFLWRAPDATNARQLVRVVDGKATLLAAAPGGYLPRQWYRLSVRTSPGFVETFIDGSLVFKVKNTWFGQGGIALVAQRIGTATFDDVRVQSFDSYRQDFTGPTGGAWTPQGGSWQINNGQLLSTQATGDPDGTRMLLAGRDDWQGYQASLAARASKTGACGIVMAWRNSGNYMVFRWAGVGSPLPYRGRQQLVRFVDGKSNIVSDEPAGILATADTDGFTAVRARLAGGALTVYSGGEVAAQYADEAVIAGRVGLWAQGATGVPFKDVVMFFPPEPVPPRVAPKMEDDALMVGWASPSGEWPPSFVDNNNEFWNTGDFFGDAAVEYWWQRSSPQSKLELALRARRGNFNSGYVVRCETAEGEDKANTLRLTLLRGGAVLKQTEFDLKDVHPEKDELDPAKPDGDKLRLRVDLEGRAVLLTVAGKPALSYVYVPTAGSPAGTVGAPNGPNMAARAFGFSLRAKDLRAFSSHRDDYTFTEAPTDWYAPQGNWNVISRWPCYSDWSFFGGKGLNPTLWSKRIYGGDTVVEMYAHNQMDLPKEIAYSRPGNLNITIGGDGKNPASGYSFIVAGWDNTATRIYRGTYKVAELVGDRGRFPKPINHNYSFHKRWYYIRAEARRDERNGRAGVLLRLSVDDEVLAEYFDPAPLESLKRGGRVCLWSLDSSIMVARTKIEGEYAGERALPSGLLDASSAPVPPVSSALDELVPRPIAVDGQPSSIVERVETPGTDNPVWMVRNPEAGGLFGVQLVKATDGGKAAGWQVRPGNRLEMDLQIPTDTKVDVYVTVDGVRHLIQLAANERPDARVRLLDSSMADAPVPSVGGRANWRHVACDLGATLQKLYPGGRGWTVEEIAIGALHGDDYRWMGFEGNAMGAYYRIRGARLNG